MIEISEPYWCREEGENRLCADVAGIGETRRLWFTVDSGEEELLCRPGGECFVLGLLPKAMQSGQDIWYAGTLQERFVCDLREYLIPSIAAARETYSEISLRAASYSKEQRVPIKETMMCFFADSAFEKIVESRKRDELYPLTHLCFLSEEGDEKRQEKEAFVQLAQRQGLKTVLTEHNLGTIYEKQTEDVICAQEFACILACGKRGILYLHPLQQKEGKPGKEEKNLDIVWGSFAGTDAVHIGFFDRKEETVC